MTGSKDSAATPAKNAVPRGIAVILLGLLMCASCGSARRGPPFEAAQLPESRPVRTGERVFMRHCHQCHPGGEAGVGPALNNKPLPAVAIRWQVRHGFGAMPAFDEEKIPDAALADLIAYLEALRR